MRKLQLCNNPGTACRRRHARCRSCWPCYGRLWRGTGPRPRHLRPRTVTPSRWFPWRRTAPARHQPRNAIHGEWAAVRVTADCHGSANKVTGVSAGPGGERMPAIYARKSLRVASARRVPEAIARTVCQYTGVPPSLGVRGRLMAANPLSALVNKTKWPAFMAASRSRQGGRHLIPSRVLIKGHTGTLRARAGHCPEVLAIALALGWWLGVIHEARRRAQRARTLPLTPGSRSPACCGVRSEPDQPALARARPPERNDGLDGSEARL